MTIPERIKAARVAARLTQKQVGESLGYRDNAQMVVARWESGARPVPGAKLRPLASLLKVTLDDLIP